MLFKNTFLGNCHDIRYDPHEITFSARTTAFTLTDRGDLKRLIRVQGPGGHLPLQAMILPQPADVHQDQLAECWKVKVEEMYFSKLM